MSERVIVEAFDLKFPVAYQVRDGQSNRTETLARLEFEALVAGDIEDIPATNMKVKDFFMPISRSTGISLGVVRKLRTEDLMKAVEVIGNFLGSGQTSGESV